MSEKKSSKKNAFIKGGKLTGQGKILKSITQLIGEIFRMIDGYRCKNGIEPTFIILPECYRVFLMEKNTISSTDAKAFAGVKEWKIDNDIKIYYWGDIKANPLINQDKIIKDNNIDIDKVVWMG